MEDRDCNLKTIFSGNNPPQDEHHDTHTHDIGYSVAKFSIKDVGTDLNCHYGKHADYHILETLTRDSMFLLLERILCFGLWSWFDTSAVSRCSRSRR